MGDDGPVYDRWDARSQAIITRADYIGRHRDCPGVLSNPGAVKLYRMSPQRYVVAVGCNH